MFFIDSCSEPELRWVPTTDRRVGPDLAQSLTRMGVVEEECDESIYWMELLIGTGRVKPSTIAGLLKESNEILSLVVASLKTHAIAEMS
jgi:hypothetical protein